MLHNDQRLLDPLARQPLLSPEEETEMAEKISEKRAAYWRTLLDWPASLDALIWERLYEKDRPPIQALRADSSTIQHEQHSSIRVLEKTVRRIADDPEQTFDPTTLAYFDRIAAARRPFEVARNILVERFTRLALRCANRQSRIPVPDAIQEAFTGLIVAAETFDPSYGTRFSPYAKRWIWRHFDKEADRMHPGVRVTQHHRDTVRKIRDVTWTHRTNHGCAPGIDELPALTGLPSRRIASVLIQGVPRQKMQITTDEEGSEDGFAVVDESHMPDKRNGYQELLDAINELSDREATVIRARLSGETLLEVGARLKLTRERIRQIEAEAVKRLRCLMDGVPLPDKRKPSGRRTRAARASA